MFQWRRVRVHTGILIAVMGCNSPVDPPPQADDRAGAYLDLEVSTLTGWLNVLRTDSEIGTIGVRSRVINIGLFCAPAGDSTDSNGNGIPDDMTLQYPAAQCPPEFTYGTSGVIRIQDIGGVWGARITYSRYVPARLGGISQVEDRLDGYVELRQTSDSTLELLDRTTNIQLNGFGPGVDVSRANDLRIVYRSRMSRGVGGIFMFRPRTVTIGGWSTMAVLDSERDSLRFDFTTLDQLREPNITCRSPFEDGTLEIAMSGFASDLITRRFTC